LPGNLLIPMKVRHQIILLLCIIITALIGFSLILQHKITRKTQELLANKLVEVKQQAAPDIFNLNEAYIKNYIDDYGVWDQAVNFIQGNGSKNWGDEELRDPLSNYKIDHIWVLDSNANYFYSVNLKDSTRAIKLSIAQQELKTQFEAGKNTHFFLNHDGAIIEVFQGSITYTNDKLRKQKPKGYLLMARKVDDRYMEKLSSLSQEINFNFVKYEKAAADKIEAATGLLQFSIPVTDFYGKPIAAFNASQNYPALKSYQQYLTKSLLYFILFIALAGLVFYLFTKHLFLNPLQLFATSLKKGNVKGLAGYINSTNEFGSMFRLTENFFDQKAKLVDEIQSGKQKEQELATALEAIKSANSEKAQTEQFLIQQQAILAINKEHAEAGLNTVLQKLLELGSTTINCEKVGMWMYNDAGNISSNHVYRLSRKECEDGGVAYEHEYPNYFKHIKEEALIVAHDAKTHPATKELAEGYLIPEGITSMLDVPIRSGNRVIGVVCFEHIGAGREWSVNEQMYARTLADVIALNYENEQRKNAEAQIVNNNLRLEQTQLLAKVGSWEINLKTNEVFWSKEMFRIFDLPAIPSTELFNAYAKRLHPEDTKLFQDAINTLVNKRSIESVEYRIISGSGEIKYLISFGEVVESKNSKTVIALRGTTQDITQQKLAALAKSEFLSCMSHEIRTPINGVIGVANLLMEEEMTPRQQEYVKTLSFSAQHLSTVVSDILDFSKIEAGHMTFEKVSFNLQKNCEYVFDLFANKAAEKGIAYKLSGEDAKDFSLYGDYVRLNQILSNLLSNAIKFTEKGTVSLSYKTIAETNHTVTVRFTVADTGIGIPQKMQQSIFESFTQADESITRRYGGTGLGLTICKKLVELQGGKISVDSVHGKGTEFNVDLIFDKHVYKDSELKKATTAEKVQERSLNGLRVLVAEDNKVNAMILTRFLNNWKAESKVACNGLEAVNLINSETFDLVLMDIQMPELNGMEATERVRNSSNEAVKKMPIIAFTADASADTHRKLLKMGFDYCMTKPFNPDALFSYLYKHSIAAQTV
jgi:signal transduction histidine kinase/ActR/RegA family two-component response regulator